MARGKLQKPRVKSKRSPAEPTPKQQSALGTGWIVALVVLPIISGLLAYHYTSRATSEPTYAPIAHGPIAADALRRSSIVESFKHAWTGYERCCWGFDDCRAWLRLFFLTHADPISCSGSNINKEPIGYTIVDTLDSLLLLGLKEEHDRARRWVTDSLSFETNSRHHAFEITIRVLGGLLAAYGMTSEAIYLDKARDLGDRLMPIFDTPSGIPASFINLGKRQLIYDRDNRNWSSVAEVGTLQLEFRYLSHLAGDTRYQDAVDEAMGVILDQPKKGGLAPLFLEPEHGRFVMSDIRLGSRGDSYYEYLLKQWLQTNQTESRLRREYDSAMSGVRTKLFYRSGRNKQAFTAELQPRPMRTPQGVQWQHSLTPKQDHLVCFLPGLLMLGVTGGDPNFDLSRMTSQQRDQWKMGEDLLETCIDTYESSRTGLGPEIVFWVPPGGQPRNASDPRDWYIDKRSRTNPHPLDGRYILRPETVESIFVAYRLTGDDKYREAGWRIFQAIERHCKVKTGGYVSIRDVDELPAVVEDRMETFFMSETLKYLYLLFSDASVVPLDRYVLTTEAHIFPILAGKEALPSFRM